MANTAMASQTVTLLPSQDTPIYADDGVSTFPFGTNSNGAGETLFVGTNGTGSARRSLIQFDLSVLPQGTAVTGAKLTLFCDREPGSEYETLSLHTVTEAWTTGGSNSDALGTPGQGAPAQPGDSTWYYRSWPGANNPDGLKWSTPGGSFNSFVVASQQVGPLSIGGNQQSVYVWSSTAIVASINAWLTDPISNFGWIMTGNETQTRSVKRFISSRGRVDNWLKPNLILQVEIPAGAPATLSLVSSANPADYAQTIDLTALVLGGSTPTGTVTFKKDGSVIAGCSNVPLAAGQAVCHIKSLPSGSYQITALYSGDHANSAIASKSMNQSVDDPTTPGNPATTIVLTSSASTSMLGQTVTFTASVRGGLAPAGTVTFMNGSQVLCNAVTLSHRTATCTRSTLSRGTHRMVALYSGDGSNLASNSPAITQTVQTGNAVCNNATKPLLDSIQKQWFVHANQELQFSVSASDCLKRPVTIKTSKLPAGSVFTQSYDATALKQTGILTWTPGVNDVENTKTLSFTASVPGVGGMKSSASQKTTIGILPPLTSSIPDAVAEASVGKLLVTKATWHPNSRQLEVLGQINWKKGTSKLIRANAIAQSIQLIDPASNAVIATGESNLSGQWRISQYQATPPNLVEAEFRGKTSLPRKVKK